MPEILDEDDLEYKMEDEDWDSTAYSDASRHSIPIHSAT